MNINTSLSGIKNAFYRQDITANNVANINTKNYKQVNVINQEAKGGGVEAKTTVSKAAPNRNGNNVSLADQMVNQISNQDQNKANVNVIRAQNEMIGSLIDIKA
ncbi:flagellar basal body protein [Hippea maritima]|uniref:Flagellar basal body rod protein n=1 Tax=Hippea maritima (strain ATCC 700847 / DSM 10411 / MH2) TaxID=760142 RepID=F2LTZ3_HIPMA|nr:flagellar basal body protein [Hippea maritima]AEA33392.1 flagellar basal body rod protein [Hippea maritima DSM 10411]